jgi:hypothetical protein
MPARGQNDLERLSSRDDSLARQPSRVAAIRTSINHLFSGRSRVGPLERSRTPDSPKTPRLPLGLGNFSSTRLHIPYLSRSDSTSSIRTPIRAQHSAHSSVSSEAAAPLRRETRRIPENHTSAPPSPPRTHYNPPASRRFVGVGPEDDRLAQLAEIGRRRRNKSRNANRRCGPKVKNRKIRAKILSCFISGLVTCHAYRVTAQITNSDSSLHSFSPSTWHWHFPTETRASNSMSY